MGIGVKTSHWKVDDYQLYAPSKATPKNAHDNIVTSDSGRTEDGIMHKNMIGQKEKVQLTWNAPTPEKASQILQAFNSEYFELTYRSPLSNSVVTKKMYRGDASAPTYWWCNGGLFTTISFDVIEV